MERETSADKQIDRETFERGKRDRKTDGHRVKRTEMHRPDRETQKREGEKDKQTDRLSQRGKGKGKEI